MRIIKMSNAEPTQNRNHGAPNFKVNMNESEKILSSFKQNYLNGLMANLSGSYRSIDKAFQIIKWLLQNQDLVLINSDGSLWRDELGGSKPCDQNGAEKNKMFLNLAERDYIQANHPVYHPVANKFYFGWCLSGQTESERQYSIIAYID